MNSARCVCFTYREAGRGNEWVEEAFQHMKSFSKALRGCDFASRYLARDGIDNDIEDGTTRLTLII